MITLNSRADVAGSRNVTTDSRQPTAGPHSFHLRSLRPQTLPPTRTSDGTNSTFVRESTQSKHLDRAKGRTTAPGHARTNTEAAAAALDEFFGEDVEASGENQWTRVNADQKSWVDI